MGKDQELLEAARNGNVAVVEKILSQRAKRSGPLASLRRGPGANVQDTSGYSALHHASLNGHQDIVELLLTHEASTNILDAKGSSPLHLAAWAGNIDIVRLLLCHGPSVPNVNLTTKDNETALHCAAQYGHTEVVTLLLEHSCDPTIRNTREETALDLAAQYGRLETVELLVRTHPELIQPYARSHNSGYVFPHTPLHLASRNGHKSVVEVLLSAGMDVNIRTSGGTALHEAALCGKLDVVRTLLDAGVDLCVRDSKHNTVLDLLSQFPKHVSQDIFKTIKRYPTSQKTDESDSEMGSLPPIPVPDLGSPYENVRGGSGSDRNRHNLRSHQSADSPSGSASPVHHWDYYQQYRDDGAYVESSRAMSRSLIDANFLSEDSYQRDVDQLSVSSAASSASGPSPRDRRPGGGDYVPMGPGSIPSPGSNSKVSPAPPKKPPRRNLSVSPTHLMTHNSLTSPGAYEYLYLARSGDEAPPPPRRGPEVLRRGKSADQYEVMKLRQSYVTPIDFADSPVLQRRKSDDAGKVLSTSERREPVALTMYCDNIQVRTTNPRRKLRRNPSDRDRVYETHEADPNDEDVTETNRTFVSNAYITLKSSQESLLDESKSSRTPVDGRNGISKVLICPLSPTNYQQPPTPDHPPPSAYQAEISIHERIRPLSQEYKRRSRDIETETEEELLIYPVMIDSSGSFSSTVSLSDKSVSTDNNVEEYIGDVPFAEGRHPRPNPPPSPGDIPPTGFRSASREETLKRRKSFMRKMLVSDDGYHSIELSPRKDRARARSDAATQTTAKVYTARLTPIDGLFRGSISQLMEVNQRASPAERPKSLRKLKNVYESEATEDEDRTTASSATDKSLSILSPFDEQEEWAKISEIMASFSSGFVRESVFVAEMEREIQARLGLTPQKTVPDDITPIGQWLKDIDMPSHESALVANGYDDLDFLNGLLDEDELKRIGVPEQDTEALMREINKLPRKIASIQKRYPRESSGDANNNNNNGDHRCEEKDEGVHTDEADAVENGRANGDDGDDEVTSDGVIEEASFTVESWLESIHLGEYKETFKRHLYVDLDRVRRIWEVELTAVLEISKSGHRRRILASMNSTQKGGAGSEPNLDELNADLSQLKSNIQQLKDEIREKLPAAINSPTQQQPPQPITTQTTNSAGLAPPAPTGTLRHSHKKSRPAPPPPVAVNGTPAKTPTAPAPDLNIRNPSELLVGVPSTLTTQWRHRPEDLVAGSIKYVANYLGSTVVKELRGTESTKKSIQKLKKTTSRELTTTPDIMLAISYRGVKFLNTGTQSLVCEHEIRNIHCACQDADDLTHFAYITKDHISRSHYCHVFCVETMDQATEVILTLGQAFEVAYQMALKEQFATAGRGHTRSQSANQIHGRVSPVVTPGQTHSRTLSVNEMKVNGSAKHTAEEDVMRGDQSGKAPLVANDDL